MSAGDAFARARAIIDERIAAERADPAIDPRCVSVLMQHDRSTERAVVLFHGFTNCPRQFAQFGHLLFTRGSNVYIPRLPHHGMADKLTSALEALTVADLTGCAELALELGSGLGASTSALGLSVGATMVAWLAQTRPLDRAIAVAPFFSVAHVPALLEPALAGALALAPNAELWWDPRQKERIGPAHGYPRFPTHALARCLQLGDDIRDLARAADPLCRHSTLVLNARDPAIDNSAARAAWDLWRERGANADEFVFDTLDARHDIIEPETYPGAAELVYPVLLRLLEA